MQKLSRRHVIATLTSSSVVLCPALLKAASAPDWGDIPTTMPVGQKQLIEISAGTAQVEISALAPGDVAVIARPTEDAAFGNTNMVQYIAVMRRTDEQIAFGRDNDRPGTVQDPNYFVADLTCPHRGKAIGFTGDPSAPFACTDQGRRHGSLFNASGFGVAGASEDEFMSIPAYSIDASGDTVVLTLG